MTQYIRYPRIGNVTGPNTSTLNDIAIFDSTDGSSIADSGVTIAGIISSITLQQAYNNATGASPQILFLADTDFLITGDVGSGVTTSNIILTASSINNGSGVAGSFIGSGGSANNSGDTGGAAQLLGGDAPQKNSVSGFAYITSGAANEQSGSSSGYARIQTGGGYILSGDVYIQSGTTVDPSGVSGDIEIFTGNSPTAGNVSITGGSGVDQGAGANSGGAVNITAGDCVGNDAASVTITGGTATTSGQGGSISLLVGNGSPRGGITFDGGDLFRFQGASSSGHFGRWDTSLLTADRNYQWPDAAGIIALTTTMTLQTTYNNNTSAPNITLADSNFQIVFPTTTAQRTILIGFDGSHYGTGSTASGITIRAQNADVSVGEGGGPITIQAGDGADVGAGGSISITAGTNNTAGGGDINLTPGNGGAGANGRVKIPNSRLAIADGFGGFATIVNSPAALPLNYNVTLPNNTTTIAGLSISGQSFTTLQNFAANISLGTGLGAVTTLNSGSSGSNKTITLFNLTGTVATIGNLSQTFSGAVTFSNATQASFSGSGGVSISGGSLTTSKQIVSTLATGTAPLSITSTTKVTNLNVDKVDGLDVTTSGAGVPDMSQANSWSGVQSHDADVKFTTVGKGIYFKEGTNGIMGTGTLSSGTATISTTKVTASSRIFLTDTGGGGNIGGLSVGTITAGTSFVVNSTNILDASTFNWVIFEPA